MGRTISFVRIIIGRHERLDYICTGTEGQVAPRKWPDGSWAANWRGQSHAPSPLERPSRLMITDQMAALDGDRGEM